MKGDAASLVRLYDSMMEMKKIYERVEGRFHDEMQKRMGKIWYLYADGRQWEPPHENFHLSCPICENEAIAVLRKVIETDPDADA